MKNLFFTCVIIFGLTLSGCSNNLKSQFDKCYKGKLAFSELLQKSEVKDYLIQNYSQQYYEKLLDCSKICSPIYYDSITNIYHLYTWKEHKFENENTVRLRYYVTQDSIATNLFINGFEIDKTGFCNYAPDCLEKAESNIQSITKLANQGYATAQIILGIYYANGDAVEQDKSKALQLVGKAVIQKLSDAQFTMGIWEDDIKKGIKWIEQSAEQDNPTALIALANLYIDGKYVKQDYTKALELYEYTARFNTGAQYMLGNIYINNTIVPSDKKKALQYYITAAENGNDKAQFALGGCYAGIMDNSIETDFTKAIYWFSKAANQGRGDASYMLAYIYFQDEMPNSGGDSNSFKGVSKDKKKGLEWLIKSAEQGYRDAIDALGQYYYQEMDIPNAIKWFKKSDSNYAQIMLNYLGGY